MIISTKTNIFKTERKIKITPQELVTIEFEPALYLTRKYIYKTMGIDVESEDIKRKAKITK